jgi:adenosylmethionine-8-amino-7-oxononanoate aminotransferase
MHPIARLDHQFIWHPFTQMRDWLKREPIVIVEGRGAVLRDIEGREYLDGNSSIWTNLHGHNHPRINAAVQRQLRKIAHTSALGLANEPAAVLAGKLVQAANRTLPDLRSGHGARTGSKPRQSHFRNPELSKVFFSDDGSTAIEVALKQAYEYARRTGRSRRPRFLSLGSGYHGDTVGAAALGHIELFHKNYSGLLFKTDEVMAPYCYRCPFNRARPDRADARAYRKCHWECVDQIEQKFTVRKRRGDGYSGFVFEPLIQGAAGMIPQPPGWLQRAIQIARAGGALLIADEVMTGFGRTGVGKLEFRDSSSGSRRPERNPGIRNPELIFACQQEGVQPDLLCLAKGMTGGYLPMAATLTTQEVFDVFLGEYEDLKTFFHGHSYTANPLGAAAALASLEVLQSADSIRRRAQLQQTLHRELQHLWSLSNVGDIRQVGLVAGIELVRDWRTREPFALRERAGLRVCAVLARHGVLTRPVGNVLVLMPPYCTTPTQAETMVRALREAIREALG